MFALHCHNDRYRGLVISKKFLFVSIFSILLFGSAVSGHEKTWPERRLRQTWSEAKNFTSKQISLTSPQIAELKNGGLQLAFNDRNLTFYLAQEKSTSGEGQKTLGVIFFVDEAGDNGPMEISVAMGADGRIKKVDIWEHAENQLIAQAAFLDQFVGKSVKQLPLAPAEFKPVPAAPKASEAVARASLKALKISSLIFQKK